MAVDAEMLERMLRDLRSTLVGRGVDVSRAKSAIRAILEVLADPAHNTDANCKVVNFYVSLQILDNEQARQNLGSLPQWLSLIIQDMGSCLHDVHQAPDLAANFESTPTQLLARLDGECERL